MAVTRRVQISDDGRWAAGRFVSNFSLISITFFAVSNVLAPEADVLEQMVAELPQLLPRTGAPAPLPDGGDDPPDHGQWRHTSCLSAARRRSRERQDESDRSGAPRGDRSAVFVAATVERKQSELAVHGLIHHHSISLWLAGGPALAAPSCSRHLIWQITARLPARNLRNFCSRSAQGGRGRDPREQGSSA
jgi:hypothetical protein